MEHRGGAGRRNPTDHPGHGPAQTGRILPAERACRDFRKARARVGHGTRGFAESGARGGRGQRCRPSPQGVPRHGCGAGAGAAAPLRLLRCALHVRLPDQPGRPGVHPPGRGRPIRGGLRGDLSPQPAPLHDGVPVRPPVHGQLHPHGLGRGRAHPRGQAHCGGAGLRRVSGARDPVRAKGGRQRRQGSRCRRRSGGARGGVVPFARRLRGPRVRARKRGRGHCALAPAAVPHPAAGGGEGCHPAQRPRRAVPLQRGRDARRKRAAGAGVPLCPGGNRCRVGQ